jgi:hypothetical protein
MTFRVGLGSGVKVNTGGQDIRAHVMPLPYKDATAGLVQVTTHIEEEARRVGGTPELMVGEGRQDVPVGTTLAMLDQAVKVLDSVHKGMHSSQAEEFSLLRDLFIDDPNSLICGNPTPARQWEMADLVKALTDCNLTPQADPNTPSHTIRVMKAVALVQLVTMNPQMWDLHAVVRRVATMVGLGSVDELFAQQDPNQQQQTDPKAMAAFANMQAKLADVQQKAQDSQTKAQLSYISEQMKLFGQQLQLQGTRENRMSQERIAGAKIENERMQLAEGALVHPLSTPVAQEFAQRWPVGIGPGGVGGSAGGRVL